MLLEKLTHIMRSRRDNLYVNRYSKSLNKVARKEEQRKILNENQSLLKRLQTGKSCYDVSQWNKDHLRHTRMVFNMCQYPYILSTNTGSIRDFPQTQNARRGLTGSSYATYYNTAITENPGSRLEIEEDRKVLCKKKKILGKKEYEVEISLKQGKIILTSEDIVTAEIMIVDVDLDKSIYE